MPASRRGQVRHILLAVCLVGAGLSGCLSWPISTSEEPLTVPQPRIGSSYVYEGEQGGLLYVNVTGTGPRLDDALRSHPSLILSTSYRAQPGEMLYPFTQSVDLAEGLTVHQVAVCGVVGDDRSRCPDERSAVLFGASGLPGSFGAAPLWGKDLPTNGTVNVTAWEGNGPTSVTYTISPVASQDGCVEAESTIPDNGTSRVPFWVGTGPIQFCGDRALPTAFRSAGGETFVLETAEAGQEAVPMDADPKRSQPAQAVPQRGVRFPLMVHDASDPAPLTVGEAHRVALDEDAGYANFFDAHPDALVSASTVSVSGKSGHRMLGAYEVTWGRRLLATAPNGDAYHVEVEETLLRNQTIDHGVSEGSRQQISVPPLEDQVPPEVAQIGPSLELGRALTGHPVDEGGGWGYFLTLPSHTRLQATSEDALDGNEVVSFHLPPSSGGGAISVRNPYYSVVDGATGDLILFERHGSDLPFDGHMLR